MLRNTYFIERHPDLTAPWPFRWRKHGAFAMTRPLWDGMRKYSQCDVVRDWLDQPNTRHSFDGVGQTWHLDVPPTSQGDDLGIAILRADEAKIFADLVPNRSLYVREHVTREGFAEIKVISLAKRPAGSSAPEFEKALSDYAESLLAGTAGDDVRRLAVCVKADVPNSSASPDSVIAAAYDGTVETSFDGIDDAVAFYRSDLASRLSTAVSSAAEVDALLVATREHVLYDLDRGVDLRQQLIAEYLMPA